MKFLTLTFVALIPSLVLADAIDEVNHCRRANGLPPLIRDASLMAGAQAKAEWQAFYHANPFNGYPGGHDGPRPPAGVQEGTAHRRNATAGWASCLMATPGTHYAGAGVAIDSNGVRYMVLWIRGSNLPSERIVPTSVPTAHLNQAAPRIPFSGIRPPSNPGPGAWFSPRDYSQFPGPRGLIANRHPIMPRQVIPMRRTGASETGQLPICPKCGRRH